MVGSRRVACMPRGRDTPSHRRVGGACHRSQHAACDEKEKKSRRGEGYADGDGSRGALGGRAAVLFGVSPDRRTDSPSPVLQLQYIYDSPLLPPKKKK